MDWIKKIGLFIAAIVISLLFASIFGRMYFLLFPSIPGTYLSSAGLRFLVGWLSAYIFWGALLFTGFAGNKKYWWLLVLVLPVLALVVFLDWQHAYFPLILALVGYGIGLLFKNR